MLTKTLAVAVLVALFMPACSKKSEAPAQPSVLTTPEVKAVEAALSSADMPTRDSALVLELRGSSFPLGTKITLDQATRKTGQHSATIEADVAGHGRWVLGLVKEGSDWRVWHTEKAGQGSSVPKSLGKPTESKLNQVAHKGNLDVCMPEIGKRVPVVFVHGLMGRAVNWGNVNDPKSLAGKANSDARLAIELLDYYSTSLLWVDDPSIGPNLANRISCLAESSRKAGGPGKVIVVAHSMGGLATRFAAAQTVNGRKVSDDLGLVVTIGTPHLGSIMSNWALSVVRDVCGGFNLPFLGGLLSLTREKCVELVDSLTALGGLRVDSEKLAALARFPNTFPVQAIAGDVQVAFNLFGVTLGAKGSDLVVAVDSARQGGTQPKDGGGVTIFSCTTALPLPGITDADCEHGRLLSNPKVHDKVLASIQAYLHKLTPPGIPFTFKGLRLWLPESWAIVSPDYVSEKTCNDGMCSGLHFMTGRERQQFIANCQPAHKDKVVSVGGKQAVFYACGTAPTPFVDIPSADILIGGYPQQIEKVLGSAQWN